MGELGIRRHGKFQRQVTLELALKDKLMLARQRIEKSKNVFNEYELG